MKRIVLIVMILTSGYVPLLAQFYPTQFRPPNLDWQELNTPHFKIVFPQGEDSAAWNTGRILEKHYQKIQDLTGGTLKDFPVVLSNYNDRSNGFVTPFHFRSEIDIAPFQGKAINPRSGTWLEAVAPHELVHALQFNNMGSYGVTKIISLFSPDLARSVHGAVPLGILEGLAVYHESGQVAASGGRGNYPYFTNQFDAVFESRQRWSMGQIVQVSAYTRPFDRHYIGGYEFTSWLQQSLSAETSKKAIRFYADYPFLGYGVALRHATGKWPGELYNEFEDEISDKLTTHSSSFTDIQPLSVPMKGVAVRRPKWFSDSTLIFYGSFYNSRPGFYLYNLNTHDLEQVKATGIVQDFVYDLSTDKSSLVYSYNKSSPIYSNNYSSELVELELTDKTTRQLSEHGRLYAPVYAGRDILALKSDHAVNELIRLSPGSDPKISSLASVDGYQIKQVSAHPEQTERLAVVANAGGLQGLWISTAATIQDKLSQNPDISFVEGSVFDPVWHPDGRSILFSSDYSGVLNIYEYNLDKNTLVQLTNSRYNAMEASYSPDGSRIAFIVQEVNKHLPVVLDRKGFYGKAVPESVWRHSTGVRPPSATRGLNKQDDLATGQWTSSSYSSGAAWLKPRALLPVVEEVSNRNIYNIGISLHSNDLLQQQAYSSSLSILRNRLWYSFDYKNTSFYPGFEASVYSEPSFVNLPFDVTGDTVYQTMLRQERSLSLAVPVNYVFEQNVYFSSLFVRPNIRQSQIRFFEADHTGSASSDFAGVTIANVYAALRYRLQQNIRDVQPNSGLLFFSEFEQYLWPTDLTIYTLDTDHRRSFVNSSGLRGGIFAYFSPLRRWNQSLRLDLRALNQNNSLFDNQFMVSEGFSEPVFPFSGNLISLGTRYTIPLFYPDKGGFLFPAYLSNVYLVAFTNTVGQYDQPDFLSTSRTVLGAGIRARFRISNLSLDLGVGMGFEPAASKTNIFIGNF